MKPKIINPLITISLSTLDNLLFCATRYCIGRRSYVSTYARDFWTIIRDHRDKFHEGRIELLAADIRSNISEHLNWADNIHTENAYNDVIHTDALSLLALYLADHPDCDPLTTRFHIDCAKCIVEIEPYIPKPNRYDTNGELIYQHKAYDPYEGFSDMLSWIKLANCIDRQYHIKCEWEGVKQEVDAIEAPMYEYGYDEVKHERTNPRCLRRFVPVDSWGAYIPQEYIKEITAK